MNNPRTCNEAIKLFNTYICGLECRPCPLHFGEKCAKDKMDEFLDNISKTINTNGDNKNAN